MAKALSPAPPHQTGRSVFPNPAFRSSSPNGFRSPGPRGCRRDLIQLKNLRLTIFGQAAFVAGPGIIFRGFSQPGFQRVAMDVANELQEIALGFDKQSLLSAPE